MEKPRKVGKTEQLEKDEYWMLHALRLAQRAAAKGEVPVAAVLVHQDREIASAYNQSISLNDPTAHAEILCLRAAGQVLNNYRFPDTTLYVTLEPCMMCAGALVHARIQRLVYAATEPKAGCVDTHLNLSEASWLNHKIEVHSGVLAEQSASLLEGFFAARRQEKKQIKKTQTDSTSAEELPVASPCVSVCALDSDDICIGCYRSCDEIRDWNTLTNTEKKSVLKRAQQRAAHIWGR